MQALANIEEVRILSNKLGSNSSQPGQFFLADRIDEGQFRQIHDKSRWNHAMCDEASCILFASLATKQPRIPLAIALVTLWNRYEVQRSPLAFVFSKPLPLSHNSTPLPASAPTHHTSNSNPT